MMETFEQRQERMEELVSLVDENLVKDLMALCTAQKKTNSVIFASVCSLFANVMGQGHASSTKDIDFTKREVAFYATVAATLSMACFESAIEGRDQKLILKQ